MANSKSVIQMSNMLIHLFSKQVLFSLDDDDRQKERSEYEQS
jgi:hypothetical protein